MATATEIRKRRAKLAHSHGIANAIIALEEERKFDNIGPALAIAMLEQESSGKNLWGHDPTIFIGGFDRKNNKHWNRRRGFVNEAGYKEYRKQRRAGGGMQGVGPMQLTWWEFQDGADGLGGCWIPCINIRYGLGRLNASIEEHGLRDGIRRYNGSGPAAEAYARSVLARREKWQDRFNIG